MLKYDTAPLFSPANEEFRACLARLQWGIGTAARILDRNRKTVMRIIQPGRTINVPREDLAVLRTIVGFVNDALDLHQNTPASQMDPNLYRQIVYGFGWGIRERQQESHFGDVTGIPPREVRLMATGRWPISEGLEAGLLALVPLLRTPMPALPDEMELHATYEGESDHDGV